MHFERSNATIISANAPQARKRYYNKPQRRFPSHRFQKKAFASFCLHSGCIPNPGTPPFLTYFLHTSNEKHNFFIFHVFLRKSNAFLTFLIRERANACIVSANAPRALKRYYSKRKCASHTETLL